MVMKKDRRKRDIKSKLVAALCMLMVSCIMVVSSTYAWFTLSTAPEVTGIQTSIGGNGNLEMALLPSLGSVLEALDAINAPNSLKNNQWGNLVDLDDDSYGLENIVLNPSTLGTVTDGKLPSHFLSAPTYGADGRVSGMNNGIMAKSYLNGAFDQDAFGVRALGTSSGMSAHEMAYRNALVAADNAFDAALAAAKNAVADGGTTLADVAIKKATGGDNVTFDQTDVDALIAAYGYVTNTLDKIEEALKRYIIADYLSSGNVTNDTFATAQTDMEGKTLAQLTAADSVYDDGISGMADMVSALTALRTEVTEQVDGLNGLSGGSYSWATLSPFVTPLADVDNMLLNGSPIRAYLDGTADISSLVDGERKLVVNTDQTDTSGIFVGMANFVDSFSTPVVFAEITYGQISLKNVSVTMVINKTQDPAYLKVADAAATEYGENVFGAGAANIDSFYGFIIDMAFRTNAADSSLLLQTDAVDRIYADNTANPETMGGGSTMTYTATQASGYNKDQLIGLMENIRIVLFDPATLEIFGYARLDASEAEVSDDGAGNISVTMPIKMYDEVNDEFAADAEGNTITKLVQNTATAVSTLVYLDGVDLENADVGNANITGTMNLQFASSAELKPMEYNDLRKPSDNTPATEYSVTVNGQDIGAKATAGATYTLNVSTYVQDGQTVTVTMGGETVENAYDAANKTVTIPNVDGDIVITVSTP